MSMSSPDRASGTQQSVPARADDDRPGAAPPARATDRDPARATRIDDGRWLGGVCTGLAQHLHCPVLVLRLAFVALAMIQFIGVLVYALLWLALPPAAPAAEAPGLESHRRTGMRQSERGRGADIGALLAVACLAAGMVWLARALGLGMSSQWFWPIAFASVGAALIWRQADAAQAERQALESHTPAWLAPFVSRNRWMSVLRVVVGLALMCAAFALVLASQIGLGELPKVAFMLVLGLSGMGVVAAPWLYRSRQALNTAREAQVRADAQADMAAHLHDSVLQTLALIQRQADDPKAVQALARRQERELRGWLYGDEVAEATFKAALKRAAADIEDDRGVPVELVVVGDDADLDPSLDAIVRAAREAILNAAKHSGASKVDVYAELNDDSVEVFVRDRGTGFNVDDIAPDRLGVRNSIIDRMERHGGHAAVRSSAEDGTEVRLEMNR